MSRSLLARFPVRVAEFLPADLRPASAAPNLYWVVHVFRTKKAMQGWHAMHDERSTADQSAHDFTAVVLPRHVLRFKGGGDRGRLAPKLGDALFHVGRTGVGVISHESAHVAIHTLRVLGSQDGEPYLDLGEDCGDAEERLAYLTGNIARLMVLGMNEAGSSPFCPRASASWDSGALLSTLA